MSSENGIPMDVKRDSISVIPIGSNVFLSDRTISATINAVNVRANNHILYEIIFWYECERKEIWVEEWEIIPESQARSTIGFRERD